MLPIMRVGPFVVQTSLILAVLGLWLGLELVSRRSMMEEDLSFEFVEGAAFRSIVFGLVIARVVYALAHLDAYLNDPAGLISPLPATLNGWAGWGAGIGLFTWLVYRKQVSFRRVLDVLAPGLAVLLITLKLGELASGTIPGIPTDVPWAIAMWGIKRHPIQLYIVIPTALAVLLSWRMRSTPFYGFRFLTIAGTFLLTTLLSSGLQETGNLTFYNLRQESVLAWLGLLAVTWAGMRWATFASEQNSEDAPEAGVT